MLKSRILFALAQFQFDTLRTYSEDMEKSIKNTTSTHIEDLHELAKNFNEHELDQFWEYNSDRVQELLNDYPNLLRSSLLISSITKLEKTFVQLHHALKTEAKLAIVSFDNKRFKGSTIKKVILSIHEAIPLDEIIESKEWKNVLFYIDIRNIVVHVGGIVHPISEEDLFKKIKSQESEGGNIVTLNEYHELMFLESFSDVVINDFQAILKALLKIIDSHLKKLKESH